MAKANIGIYIFLHQHRRFYLVNRARDIGIVSGRIVHMKKRNSIFEGEVNQILICKLINNMKIKILIYTYFFKVQVLNNNS